MSSRIVLFIVVVLLSISTGITTYFTFNQIGKTNDLSIASKKQSADSKRISIQNRKLGLMNRRLALANKKLIDQVKVIAKEGKDAHDALCIVRGRLARDIGRTEKFLRENPQGIPGIPSKLILEGLASDKNDLKSLKGLRCS